MKTIVLLAFIGILLPVASYAQSAKESEIQKIYIKPSQFTFTDEGMFAYVESEWIPVSSLYSDAEGVYLAYSKYPWMRWICTCGYNNYGGDQTCQRRDEINGKLCGRPRPPG